MAVCGRPVRCLATRSLFIITTIIVGVRARRSLPTAIGNEKNQLLVRMVELSAHLNLHRGGASLMVYRLSQFVVKSSAMATGWFAYFGRPSLSTRAVWYSLL